MVSSNIAVSVSWHCICTVGHWGFPNLSWCSQVVCDWRVQDNRACRTAWNIWSNSSLLCPMHATLMQSLAGLLQWHHYSTQKFTQVWKSCNVICALDNHRDNEGHLWPVIVHAGDLTCKAHPGKQHDKSSRTSLSLTVGGNIPWATRLELTWIYRLSLVKSLWYIKSCFRAAIRSFSTKTLWQQLYFWSAMNLTLSSPKSRKA